MNLRMTDLKNFLEIASSRTMREGAEKLGITQPALSESIKRLEEDLGEILLYRSRSGIALTPGGQKTALQAKEVFKALGVLGLGKDLKSSRLITIGCHSMIASYFFPKAFSLIQKENPNYQIQLRHDLSRIIQLEVQQGKIDIGIVVNSLPSPDLIVRQVAKDEVCVWKHKGFNIEDSNKVFCNLALFQTQSILRKWKTKPHHVINVDNLELIARFTNEGLGYGIIPTRAVELLDMKNCKIVEMAPTFQDTISILYRPEFGKHPEEKLVIESLKRAVT